MKFEKNSSIFWTWGSYVFLPINIIVGSLIYQQGGNIVELCMSLFWAFIIIMLLTYPAIIISTKNHINYAQAINKYVKNNILSKLAIILLPVVNMGWYSIQTGLFVDILEAKYNFEFEIRVFLIFLFSVLFALGVIIFKYEWLKRFGQLSMLLLLTLLFFNVSFKSIDFSYNEIRLTNVLFFTLQIIGTWVYSSVTCIMDITSHVEDGNKAFLYVLLATFVADMMLIFFGYTLQSDIISLTSSNILFFITILAAIWSTNDGNFYSTMCSLKELKLKKIILLIPPLCGLITLVFIRDFEGFIIKWLSMMSWIGIPVGIFWWHSLFKEKRYDNSIRRN